MRAIRVHEFGEPGVLRLETIDDLMPQRGQVVVRVRAIGVNPVDTYIRAGAYARKPDLPYTPGTDAAGTIEVVGEAVTKFKTGDRVYVAGTISGAYAEFCLCDENQVQPLPENINFEQGAGIYVPYATAYRALFQKAGVKAGETVLIHGASGGVGIAAVQWAKRAGLNIIGTGGSETGRNLIFENGAHHALDHSAENYLDEAMKITDGRGVDVVIEMLANVNLDRDFGVLAGFGRVVIVGNRGRIEIDPRQTMSKDAVVYGMSLWNTPDDQMKEIHRAIGIGLENGALSPVIGQTLALADARTAHYAILESGSQGKIVLIP